MKIICEGPDGGGKSTWVQAMSEKFGTLCITSIGSINPGSPRTPSEVWTRMDEQDSVLSSGRLGRPAIVDRHTAVSQYVYDIATKRPNLVGKDLLLKRMHGFEKQGYTIIFFNPSNMEAVLESLITKPHKPPEWIDKVKHDWPKIQEEYMILFEFLKAYVPIFEIDRFGTNSMEIL